MGSQEHMLHVARYRMTASSLLAVVLTPLVIACGGRTEGGLADVDIPPDTSPQTSGDDPGSTVGSNGSKGTVLRKTTPLQPCVPGIEQASATVCDYYAEGRCYVTKLDACACVCPRNSQNSICLSSFDVPSRVTCF